MPAASSEASFGRAQTHWGRLDSIKLDLRYSRMALIKLDGFEHFGDTDNRLMEREVMLFKLHIDSGRVP